MEAGRLRIGSAVLPAWLLIRSDKAAARTESLVAGHSYMARVGVAQDINRGAMFFSICVSEPDYAYRW